MVQHSGGERVLAEGFPRLACPVSQRALLGVLGFGALRYRLQHPSLFALDLNYNFQVPSRETEPQKGQGSKVKVKEPQRSPQQREREREGLGFRALVCLGVKLEERRKGAPRGTLFEASL